ncbi:hypothetical protein Tco_0921860 [Tanacetum coccineum]
MINTVYPPPLDTAYSSCKTETKILVVHDKGRHFKTLSLVELRSPDFNLLSDQEYSEEEEAEAMAETMEQYMSKTRTDYGSGVARPKLIIIILDPGGTVPTKTAVDAKMAIQELAEYSQKWHNGKYRGRITETSNGLAAIQAQLNSLGKGDQKEEGKTLEEAYYTQFGRPFQGGGYRATTLGYYQRNNANPSYQERRQSMEDTLSKFMSESAKRHEENSNLIKEIRATTDAAIRNQ